MSASPHLTVTLDRAVSSAAVLSGIKACTGLGLSEIRSRIDAGLPMVIEEMFSNAWYDERAEQLLALLTEWRDAGIAFELQEVAEGDDDAPVATISLEVLRNIVGPDGGDAPPDGGDNDTDARAETRGAVLPRSPGGEDHA